MVRGEIATRDAGGTLARSETGTVISTRPTCGPADTPEVLTGRELRFLDDVIADAEQSTGLRFAAYLGDLGADTRAGAENLLGAFGDDAAYTVLLAISPGQRIVEVVTGTEASLRISDRATRVAVLSAVAACGDGDLAGGLTNGIRVLADQAGELVPPSTY